VFASSAFSTIRATAKMTDFDSAVRGAPYIIMDALKNFGSPPGYTHGYTFHEIVDGLL